MEKYHLCAPWLASLESHAFPKLGDVPTGGIVAADIIDVLMPIWQEIPETARQVRNRICVVLDLCPRERLALERSSVGRWQLESGTRIASPSEVAGESQGHAL